MSNNGIVFGYHIYTDNYKKINDFKDVNTINNMSNKDSKYLWLHLDGGTLKSKEWLIKESGIPKVVCNSLLSEDSRPRVLSLKEGILINLRGLNLNPNSDAEDMVFLHMWIDSNRIITIRREKVLAIDEINNAITQGQGPNTKDSFLRNVLENLTMRINDYISEMEDEVDDLEDQVVAKGSKEIRKHLSEMRRKTILIRRYIVPQRDVLSKLHIENINWMDELDRLYIRELAEKTTRLVEELDTIRDRAAIIQEELNNKVTEEMNRTMYILSIVGSIFLPLSFLTGLFGINIGGMPGTDSPNAFLFFTVSMVFIAFIEYLIFKRNDWI
ncbi:MAG: zinc transporter ZntB [Firmicutes bacterium]|nr:zinc transporter ZntB [Bacillota bacterium]